MGRITLQGALRFDRATSIFPAATIGGVRFLPTVTSFPETKGVDAYKDLTPRGGVAIDLFGDGKTALKFNVGRYLEAAQNGGLFIASRPTSRISTTASRTWTDTNGNFRPDCDLSNNAAQNLSATGGDVCGAVAEHELRQVGLRHDAGSGAVERLGRPVRRLAVGRVDSAADRAARVGRAQLPSPLAAEFRRDRQPRDRRERLRQVQRQRAGRRAASERRRLRRSRPLYNVNPSKASVAANNFVTLDTNYGGQNQTSNAIALNLSARPRNGLVIQGGFNTNNTSFDYCSIRAAMPELTIVIGPPTLSPTNPYCNYNTGWVTRYHGARLLHDSEDRRADRRHRTQR